MKNKIYFLISIILLGIAPVYAQKDSVFWNSEMKKIAGPTSNADWINIKQEINLDPQTFFSKEKKALALGLNDDMRLNKTEKDKTGITHYRFDQFYKGYKIIGGEFLLHAKEGKLLSANGKMIKGLNKNPVIIIPKEEALQKAKQFLPAARYAWEVPQAENNYKLIKHDENATYKPKGELVWISTEESLNSKDPAAFVVAYMFDLYTSFLNGKRIFVNAQTGLVIRSLPLTSECTPTSVNTNFYGVQNIFTRAVPNTGNPTAYNLWDDCQPAFIRTQHWNSTQSNYSDYISFSNNGWNSQSSAATSHWCVETAYNYYKNVFDRDGWDSARTGVIILQDALFCNTPMCTPTSPDNASMGFGNGIMKVGNAGTVSTIDDYNSLDIIAHEFTHAVTAASAQLVYEKETGALNESYSDILGASCLAWRFGINGSTWLIGFARKDPSNGNSLWIRDMSNPNHKNPATPISVPQPDTYLSKSFWIGTTLAVDTSGDNWGVHTNSGVQNYMYYLLVNGGVGVNDNANPFSVFGIGIAAASDIAYRSLNYLPNTAQFADARNAWVHAAIDLYGPCSLQAIETGKAWDAVGLPPPEINESADICGTLGAAIFTLTNPNIFSLSPNNCHMTVVPSSLVEFGANKVIMYPGFHAQYGSHFRAYVSECRYAAF
ncbi:MAG: M4 family metallopeptidase [Ferruginibacter sp.]